MNLASEFLLITGAGKSIGSRGGQGDDCQCVPVCTPRPDPVPSFRTPTALSCVPGSRDWRRVKGTDLATRIWVEFSFPPSLKRTPRGTQ